MFGAVLEGGTLTSSAGPRRGLPVLHALAGVRGAESGWGVWFVGTLLGPEGAGNRSSLSGPVVCRTAVFPVGRAGLAVEFDRCLVVR